MIYKITNTVNSKAYVGYSSNVESRWEDHKKGYGSKLVYDAIQKYRLDNFTFEVIAEDTVDNEDKYIQEHNTMAPNGYNLVEGGGLPPSQKGRKASPEKIAKGKKTVLERYGQPGVPRTEEWCKNLSESKSGKNNPRYGIKENPDTKEQRLTAMIRTKNAPNYDLYKKAIALMDNGKSADTVSKELGVGRGVCFKLKNRTHGFFQAFPELI